MKLRPSLKNLARAGLNLFIAAFLLLGCSSSTTPTYKKENIEQSVHDILKNEYKLDSTVKLVGSTLWIYLPQEDMLEKAKKPEKYTERFSVKEDDASLKDGTLQVSYAINELKPQQEKLQEYNYSKATFENINSVWKTIRRVLFSVERSQDNEPKFFCLINADIKNGFETKEVFYYLDLKKVSYELISWTEYQHRTIQASNITSEIIGDKEGKHVDYQDITMEEFITGQIKHRITLKFQKPELFGKKPVDIDKEVLKIVANTVKIYDFRDFAAAELNNLLTQNKVFFNRAAVFANPID